MFINPMWDSESQRIGMQRCTPSGYAVRVLSDFVGLLSLLSLAAAILFLVYQAVVGRFQWAQLWMIGTPFFSAFFGMLLNGFAWRLAASKDFRYDAEKCIATWMENGQSCSYEYDPMSRP